MTQYYLIVFPSPPLQKGKKKEKKEKKSPQMKLIDLTTTDSRFFNTEILQQSQNAVTSGISVSFLRPRTSVYHLLTEDN